MTNSGVIEASAENNSVEMVVDVKIVWLTIGLQYHQDWCLVWPRYSDTCVTNKLSELAKSMYLCS